MAKKYIVNLEDDEREILEGLIAKGNTKARKLNRAHILLLSDEGKTDEYIAESLHISKSTVERTRRRFVDGGLDKALNEDARPGQKCKLTGKEEALVIALACSDPPAGRVRWTLRLLADKVVELEIVESISHETIRNLLKKVKLNPGKKSSIA